MKAWIRYTGMNSLDSMDWEEIDVPSKEEAWSMAYEEAVHDWYSYEGLHGNFSIEDIMEMYNCSEDEAYDIQVEDVESAIDYEVVFEKPEE